MTFDAFPELSLLSTTRHPTHSHYISTTLLGLPFNTSACLLVRRLQLRPRLLPRPLQHLVRNLDSTSVRFHLQQRLLLSEPTLSPSPSLASSRLVRLSPSTLLSAAFLSQPTTVARRRTPGRTSSPLQALLRRLCMLSTLPSIILTPSALEVRREEEGLERGEEVSEARPSLFRR